jgi:hypothetical protein
MKRMVFAVAVALVMAVMLAPGALAQEAVADENCTFENGKTTCTESVFSHSVWVATSHVDWGYDPSCGETLIFQDYYADVYETTTTVYKGKSSRVVSTQTTLTQGEPYPYGEPWQYCIG